MKNRYFINKLGLINFWYYDIEEFNLSEGNLLLRGTNGCGKSVTMQSFLPLLLDGNKSPERLDPFGTKARTISNYLLDENDNEKTAYLYMEFKKGDEDNYITVGMGLKAIKNKPVQSWYFILSDGRRIGKELFLYRDAGELIPLTKIQLKNELGDRNFYTESQKSYMEMVNKYLFGFDDIEAYEELLNLLISIRSPKLSKDFKPTEIYKILADSLKVLSDEDLRPMSDSMENMDNLTDGLDENKRAYKAANNIKYHYDKYNEMVLLEKGRVLLKAYNKLNEYINQKNSKSKDLKKIHKEIDSLNSELEEKETEYKRAEESYEKLINREEFKSKKELDDIKIRLSENRKSKIQKEESLETKNGKRRENEISIKELNDNKDLTLKKILEYTKVLEELANELKVESIIGVFAKEIEGITLEDFNFCDTTVRKFESKLKLAERLFKDYEYQKEKLSEITKEVDKLEKDKIEEMKNMERTEELLLTEKENYKVNINKVLKSNTLYDLNENEKLDMFGAIDRINEYSEIQDVKSILQESLNNRINDKKSNINLEEKIVEEYKEEIRKIKEEINELKNNKDIEPERSIEVKKNRERLVSLGIDYIPLYKAIDFRKDTSEEVRGYIEASLISMGLLDALIIDPKNKKKAMEFNNEDEDKYIFSDPNLMSFNLSNILSIDKELNDENLYNEVDNVLQSIFLEASGSTYLDEKGNFQIGILGGKAKAGYNVRFIGESSRRRHREELIKEKEAGIDEIKSIIDKYVKNIEYIKSEINILQMEYNKLPHSDSILEALKLVKGLEIRLKALDSEIIKIKNKQFDENKNLKNIKLKLMEDIKGFDHINSLKLVEENLEIIDEYKEVIGNGRIGLNDFETSMSIVKLKEDSLENILIDIDNLYYDINMLNRKISEDEIKESTILEALSKIDMVEIEKEIDSCIKIKRENPEIIKSLSNNLGEKNITVENLKEDIEKLFKKIEENEKEYSIYEKIFDEEYCLNYVSEKEEGDILSICEKVVNDLTSDNEKNRDYYSNTLTKSISDNSAELREYSNKEVVLFSNEELQGDKRWLRERRDFKWKIQGKDVNLLVLIDEIKKAIEELELLISEEERKVFEEVLINTISQKVRAKIYQSKNWVEKINELMNSMDTSSSLKLNLAWVPKKSDSEGQLDVSKLIEILSRGDRNTEADLKKLAKHFSEKVQEELRKYEGSGEVRNYHSIIKDVLDYRKWYEFKLYYIKNHERKKELTNNAFFQFSGGEKAMAMYIPLFSAIYARYEKGRVECPRIISMDEAFAGVDENNIRDMFRLLKELDLDYILNSQILWGDYDTVDNLAISELIREENDDVVTVLNYLWNGKEKVLLNE